MHTQLNYTQAKRLVDIEPTEAEARSFIAKMESDGTITAEVGANLRAAIDWEKPRQSLR
jgi:hypothetical protein